MELEARVDPAERRLERLEARQPVVAFEASPATGGESCRDSAGALQALVGARLGAAFLRRLSEAYGGPRGCTHLLTLARLLASGTARALDLEAELAGRGARARRARLPARARRGRLRAAGALDAARGAARRTSTCVAAAEAAETSPRPARLPDRAAALATLDLATTVLRELRAEERTRTRADLAERGLRGSQRRARGARRAAAHGRLRAEAVRRFGGSAALCAASRRAAESRAGLRAVRRRGARSVPARRPGRREPRRPARTPASCGGAAAPSRWRGPPARAPEAEGRPRGAGPAGPPRRFRAAPGSGALRAARLACEPLHSRGVPGVDPLLVGARPAGPRESRGGDPVAAAVRFETTTLPLSDRSRGKARRPTTSSSSASSPATSRPSSCSTAAGRRGCCASRSPASATATTPRTSCRRRFSRRSAACRATRAARPSAPGCSASPTT